MKSSSGIGATSSRTKEDTLRKRLSIALAALTAAAVMIPAPSASASSCQIQDPGIDDVICIFYGTPYWKLCVALGVCQPPG